jgi:hypothetical protein
MPAFKRRDKLVCFRIAVDEYEEVERSCISTGSRSISEFARTAALARARHSDAPEQGLQSSDVSAICTRLTELDYLVRDIRFRFRRLLGPERLGQDQAPESE